MKLDNKSAEEPPRQERVKSTQTSERRKWIRERLEQDGQVRYDELRRQFQKVTRKIIKTDFDDLLRSGWAVSKVQDKNDQVGVIVLMSKTHPYTVIHRASLKKEGKQEIARVATGIIWGPKIVNADSDGLKKVLTQNEIIKQLDIIAKTRNVLASQKAEEVKNNLHSYWQKSHRSISTDAGSTCLNITECVSKIRIPDPDSLLSALDVFTNSSMIVDVLRDPKVSVGVVIIGGRLRTTDACAGELTRQCLERWHLQLDVAIVGTTNINTKTLEFACDSENESLTKNLILSRATLRVIVADSSKLRANTPTSSFAFCPINGSSIDILCTDNEIQPSAVDMLLGRGVVVLTPGGSHLTRLLQK